MNGTVTVTRHLYSIPVEPEEEEEAKSGYSAVRARGPHAFHCAVFKRRAQQ